MKYKVSASVLKPSMELRGYQFIIDVDDKTSKDQSALMKAAQLAAKEKYGPDTRVTRVTAW